MTQKALFLEGKQGDFAIRNRGIRIPESGQVLIRVEAVGLNPADWKVWKHGPAWISNYPAILGLDGAGVIEEVGSGVKGLVKGDRVLFPGILADNDSSTFQQYAISDAVLAAKIPSNISLEQAASVPICVSTAAVGLYLRKSEVGAMFGAAGLQAPWAGGEEGKYVGQPLVVLGGASAVGFYVIQFAKISGFSPIIATASLHNEELLKSIGATHVIDRNAPLAPSVLAITDAPVDIVFDAISLPETQQADPIIKLQERETKTLARVSGLVHLPDQKTVSEPLWRRLPQWLADGTLVPMPIRVLPGGLSAIQTGLKLLEDNKVSGTKLVIRPQESR